MGFIAARCVICTSEFHSGNIAALPCGHTFHHHCILQWFKNSKTCPQCRTRVNEKNVIKQLFFENNDENTTVTNTIDYAVKSEQLSIELQAEKELRSTAEHELTVLRKELSSTKEKLEKSRKRLPEVESRLRHLEGMKMNEDVMQKRILHLEACLRASELYKCAVRGKDENSAHAALNKYVKDNGDINDKQFLIIMRNQLDKYHKLLSEKNVELSKTIAEKNEAEKNYKVQKDLFNALVEEAKELRLAAQKNTPYNPKLKAVFAEPRVRKPSLGFDESLEIPEDLLDRAFENRQKEADTSILAPRDYEKLEILPNKDFPLPFPNLDDTINDSDDLRVPKAVLERVIAGPPKRQTNAMGAAPRGTMGILNRGHQNDKLSDKKIETKPVKKTSKRKQEPAPSTGKNARISSFFGRTHSDPQITFKEEIIHIE